MTTNTKSKRHPHADLIIAWANGATIEVLCIDGYWRVTTQPLWCEYTKYRIKPKSEFLNVYGLTRTAARGQRWHKSLDHAVEASTGNPALVGQLERITLDGKVEYKFHPVIKEN